MIDFEIEGLQDTIDGMWGLSLGAQRAPKKMVEVVTEEMADSMREHAPVWKGGLRDSITSEFGRQGNTFWGVAKTGVHWAAPQEFGTGKQGPSESRYFPNPTNLEEWAVSHDFESGWHLAVVIAKYGTKPTNFTEKSFKAVIEESLQRATYDLMEEITP